MEQQEDNYLISKERISKTIALLVIPAILGSAVAQLNMIVDSFFLSRIADDAVAVASVAATGIAFPIILIIMSFANLFAIGGSIYGAQTLGENNKDKARDIFSGTMRYALIFNFILIILLLIFLNPLLYMLGATDASIGLSHQYAFWAIVGSPSIILTFIVVMFARSEGKAMLVFSAILIQTIANFILNYILIFPFDMGTAGASIATVISQTLQFIIVGKYLFTAKSQYQYKVGKINYSINDLKTVFTLGFPATIGFIYITVTSLMLTVETSFYANDNLNAALGVLVKFFTMFTMIVQAAVSGIQPVFSFAFGAKDKERFDDARNTFRRYLLIASSIIGIILIIFPAIFTYIFTLPAEANVFVTTGTRILGIMILTMPLSFLIQTLFQSINNAKISLVIVSVRQFVCFIIINPLLVFVFGIDGLIISYQIAITVGAVITIIQYRKKLENAVESAFE